MTTTSARPRARHDGRVHLARAAHPDQLGDGRRLDRASGPRSSVTSAPRRARLRGEREAHPAARSVAEEADRIDVLVGRTGRDDDAPARAATSARRQQHARRPRRSRPAPPAGPCRPSRTRDSPSPGSTNRTPRAASVAEVPLHRLVLQHVGVHRRRHQHRRRVARYSDDRKSSAMPLANLPMMLAVAGATSSKVDARWRARCARCRRSGPGANCDVITGSRVIASNVSWPDEPRARCAS